MTASLSRRETQVCELLCQGQSNKVIAIALEMSPRTVEDHRSNILKKMGVANCTLLVHKILSKRIAELEAVHVGS